MNEKPEIVCLQYLKGHLKRLLTDIDPEQQASICSMFVIGLFVHLIELTEIEEFCSK